MEFETNTPTTERDLALANAPRVTVQPRPSFSADLPPLRVPANSEMNVMIESEQESTAMSATESHEETGHGHRVALITSLSIMTIFTASIAGIYLLR